MWHPQLLTTLQASTACNGDSYQAEYLRLRTNNDVAPSGIIPVDSDSRSNRSTSVWRSWSIAFLQNIPLKVAPGNCPAGSTRCNFAPMDMIFTYHVFEKHAVWTQCPGYNWATQFLGKINTETWPLGGIKMETLKYARESRGTQTWERLRWRFPARTENYRPDFSSEMAPISTNPQLSKIIKERSKIGWGSQIGAWHQDRLADWSLVVI
jgi:hypothetical protein